MPEPTPISHQPQTPQRCGYNGPTATEHVPQFSPCSFRQQQQGEGERGSGTVYIPREIKRERRRLGLHSQISSLLPPSLSPDDSSSPHPTPPPPSPFALEGGLGKRWVMDSSIGNKGHGVETVERQHCRTPLWPPPSPLFSPPTFPPTIPDLPFVLFFTPLHYPSTPY